MNKINIQIFFIFMITYCQSALAYSPFLDQSNDMYSVRNRCEMCHSGMNLNSFGKDFKTRWKENKNIVKSFLDLEKYDSDNDGFSNLEEIKSKSIPGDKVSTPKMIIGNKPDLFRKK